MSGKLTGPVVNAARDIANVGTAYDAERLVSTLLGAVYSALPPDRSVALDAFVDDLRDDLAASTDPPPSRASTCATDSPAPGAATAASQPTSTIGIPGSHCCWAATTR